MPVIKVDTTSSAGAVRIRAKAIDLHAGLQGHAYIAARGLNKPVQRLVDAHAAEGALNILTKPPVAKPQIKVVVGTASLARALDRVRVLMMAVGTRRLV